MIITKLSYGLANQMFQYAAGKALAVRNDQALELDLSFFNADLEATSKPSHEEYRLDIFEGTTTCKISDSKYLKQLTQKFGKNLFYKILNKASKQIGKEALYNYCWEKQFLKFDSTINSSSGKIVYLSGYFQNEEYFKDAEKVIRANFTFKNHLIDEINLNLGTKMKQENSVSVHVRRGDYVGKRFIPPISYYENAIKLMASRICNPIFYVFSDDSDWAAENIKGPGQFHYVTHNTLANSFKDMYLMSKCMHNIIANSSFSWWGAWLNDHESKLVISPKQWLPENNVTSSDIIPNTWIQL